MTTTRLQKKTEGYNYKYTELADINAYIEGLQERYYQYIEPNDNGNDYIMTVRVIDGKPTEPIRGCKVVNATLQGKSNPAQEYGSALTYARRYSLLMAYGLATTDDDAATFDEAKEVAPKKRKKPEKSVEYKQLRAEIEDFAKEHNMTMAEIGRDYKLSADSTEEDLRAVLTDLTGEDNE